MQLDLTGQATKAGQINTRITTLKNELNKRIPVWDKISIAKKKKWLQSGKDPILTLAYQVWSYLDSNFRFGGLQ